MAAQNEAHAAGNDVITQRRRTNVPPAVALLELQNGPLSGLQIDEPAAEAHITAALEALRVAPATGGQ